MDCGYLKINKCDELTACFAVAYDPDTRARTYTDYITLCQAIILKSESIYKKGCYEGTCLHSRSFGGRFSVNS